MKKVEVLSVSESGRSLSFDDAIPAHNKILHKKLKKFLDEYFTCDACLLVELVVSGGLLSFLVKKDNCLYVVHKKQLIDYGGPVYLQELSSFFEKETQCGLLSQINLYSIDVIEFNEFVLEDEELIRKKDAFAM